MGKRGREHVEKLYRWEENAEYMVTLYDQKLKKGKGFV
jgi:hypothetical protein